MSPADASRRWTLCSATLGEDGRREPPLGPLYIAAAVEACGVEVDFRDFQLHEGANGFSGDQLADCLVDHAPVVAISCFVDMLPAVVDATRQLHARRPDTVFLLGGPGPTASAREILLAYPWISAVVRGEGEETVRDWISLLRGEREGEIPGMTYRKGDELVGGPDRPRITGLDELPLPAYHLLDWTDYTDARVITTRGCSYRCSFCDVTALWGNRSVYRDVEATIREMEMLRDARGAATVSIVDDTFVLNRARVRAFCRSLIARRADLEWGCFARINLMTPDLVELMAAAGCRAVFYGIDSGSQAILDRTAKHLRAADVVPVLRTSAQAFDTIEASFIWGYPFETLDDFRSTLELAGDASMLAPTVNVQLHLLSPLPMSPIHRQYSWALAEPDVEDRPWLLLPAVFLDERANVVREIVRSAPHIHPGFYTFPSPDKPAKRALLQRTLHAMEGTVGRTLLDERVRALVTREDGAIGNELLAAESAAAERVGVGLALGYLRRIRRARGGRRLPLANSRGPRMVRERSDSKGG